MRRTALFAAALAIVIEAPAKPVVKLAPPNNASQLAQGCSRGTVKNMPTLFPLTKASGDVRDIHFYYVGLPGTPNENIRARNAAIRKYFQDLRSTRSTAYAAFSCESTSYRTCTSSTGNTKTCYHAWRVKGGKQFVRNTFTYSGRGLASGFQWRYVEDTGVRFVMRKSGDGVNRLNMRASLRVRPRAVTSFTERELQVLRTDLKTKNLPDDKVVDP